MEFARIYQITIPKQDSLNYIFYKSTELDGTTEVDDTIIVSPNVNSIVIRIFSIISVDKDIWRQSQSLFHLSPPQDWGELLRLSKKASELSERLYLSVLYPMVD